jgi:DNA-binding response OmpR family regulator
MDEAGRILVVDDEAELRRLVRFHLEREGFQVEEAADGDTALRRATSEPFDLVVLDVMLPGRDGFDVCRRLRARSDLPVILLTARTEETDRVLGLDLGADDYVPKPFSPRELAARVRAVLRRRQGALPERLTVRNVTVEADAHRVTVAGREVALTATEFAILLALVRARGRVLSRERLLAAVWGADYFGDVRTVDVHIRHLREKLQAAGALPVIETVRGVGYRAVASP